MGLQTSAAEPVPVRRVSQLIAGWIARLGTIWVEGQVTQISRRPGATVVFLTLRDPAADISVSVTCHRRVLEEVQPPLADGQRVVVHAKPEFYAGRGTLSLAASEIRPVGVGELLARLEHLKRVLAAEGLFAADRKRPLPFLPGTVGLVCGRASAAEHDVLTNARHRWPAVRFRVLPVAVQGPYAVQQVSEAVQELDGDPAVEVIVIARGGGSLEDLLPFSDESLVRTVARCRTPVVSAIGHEQDSPILDLVADVRASTPTDAAKKVVPDVGEETARIRQLRDRLHRGAVNRIEREQAGLDMLRHRPVLAHPLREVDRRDAEIREGLRRLRQCLGHRLERADDELRHTRARVLTLSPAATLQRGYAVVQREDGRVVRAPGQVEVGDLVEVRLAEGRLAAEVRKRVEPDPPH